MMLTTRYFMNSRRSCAAVRDNALRGEPPIQRAVGLWHSVFELRLAYFPCPWAAYENDELRIRGQPFQELA
jgi:hypothetical protein